MARPTLAQASTALSNLFDALTFGNTPWRLQRSGAAVDALGSVASAIRDSLAGTTMTIGSDAEDADVTELFAFPQVSFTVTDSVDADLPAFFLGELFDAIGRTVRVGDEFAVTGTGDVTDNALDTAKGGAVANLDIFQVSDIGTEAVVYRGNLGRLGVTLGRRPEAGDVFSMGAATNDLVDNALSAAKIASRVQVIDIVVTDGTDADAPAFIAASGEIGLVLGRALVADEIIKVGGTGATTDNALAGAKGGAVADGDLFQVNSAANDFVYLNPAVASSDVFEVTSVVVGSETVSFLGNGALSIATIKLARGA